MTDTKKLPDTALALTGNLTARECATVLAALRYWQETLGVWGITNKSSARTVNVHVDDRLPHFDYFEDQDALTLPEIDALCERINLQPLPAEDYPQDDENTPAVTSSQQYAQQGGVKCPWCGSEDIEGRQVEVDAGGASQSVTCNDCLREWQDNYRLVGFETP